MKIGRSLPQIEPQASRENRISVACRAQCSDMEVVSRAFTVVTDEAKGEGRNPMMGTIDQVQEDIRPLRDIGVTHLIHSPPALDFTPSTNVDEGLALMERLIEISR